MLNKVTQLAEHAATKVSRRQFLTRLRKGAVAAAALGTFLALPRESSAGRNRCPKGYKWCRYYGHCIENGQHCLKSGDR